MQCLTLPTKSQGLSEDRTHTCTKWQSQVVGAYAERAICTLSGCLDGDASYADGQGWLEGHLLLRLAGCSRCKRCSTGEVLISDRDLCQLLVTQLLCVSVRKFEAASIPDDCLQGHL